LKQGEQPDLFSEAALLLLFFFGGGGGDVQAGNVITAQWRTIESIVFLYRVMFSRKWFNPM